MHSSYTIIFSLCPLLGVTLLTSKRIWKWDIETQRDKKTENMSQIKHHHDCQWSLTLNECKHLSDRIKLLFLKINLQGCNDRKTKLKLHLTNNILATIKKSPLLVTLWSIKFVLNMKKRRYTKRTLVSCSNWTEMCY